MKTSGKILAAQVDSINESEVFKVRSGNLPTWCPGCGYFGIHQGLNNAIQEMAIPHHEIVTVSGIGCAGRYPFFSNTYGIHALHGRALPMATGVKLGKPELTVFAVGGDGDGLGIGGGHLPHICRRDINVNYLLFDNSIYGLTKGQTSPSSPTGFKTKTTPDGNLDQPLNATLMTLAYGAGFVARLFAGDPEGITRALLEGIKHPGFAFFHIYTSCVTFDKQFKTWDNLKERIHPIPASHDRHDRAAAIAHIMEDDYSTGVVYEKRG